MTEKILEIYEGKISEERSFWKNVRNADGFSKFLLWYLFLGLLLIISLAIFVQSPKTLYFVGFYTISIYILTQISERIRHGKGEENLVEYHKELDQIASILKDNKLYEKNALKQLIHKYYRSIEEGEAKNEKKSGSIREFICTYIVPIIAFFLGKLDLTTTPNTEWLAIGIVSVIVVASGKYIYSAWVELIMTISWNQLEKEKKFVLKLQDLLDRDFLIEQEDLLA